MSRSKEAARSKIKHAGAAAVCNVCGVKKMDVVNVKKNWFTSINICDSCGHYLFLSFRRGLGGNAK